MPQHDSTPADLLGSAAAILTGSLAALASSLALRVVLARALSPTDLGALLLGISIVSFAGVSASLGLRTAGARRVASRLAAGDRAGAGATARTSLATALASGALVSAALLAAAHLPPFAGATGKLPPGLLGALTPAVLGLAAGTSFWGVSQGFGDTRGRALWRDPVGGALRLAAVAAAALLAGGGLLALALGWALGSLLGEALFGVYCWRQGWFRRRHAAASPAGADRAFLAGLPPFAANTFLHQVVRWLDMLLVGLLAPLAVVAIYGLAQSVYRVLGMVQGAAAHRFLPLATAAATVGDEERLAATYRQARDLTFRFLWLPLAACLLCPRELVVLAFGEEYAAAGTALRVLAAALAASALCGYTEDLLYARDRPRAVFARVCGVTAATALLLVALVPRWGALGAAVATATGLLAGTLFDLVLIGGELRRAVLGRSLVAPAKVAAAAVLVAAALAAAGAAGFTVPPLLSVALVTAAAAPPALGRLVALRTGRERPAG